MANAVTKITLPGGTEVSLGDWQTAPMYSTIDIEAPERDSVLEATRHEILREKYMRERKLAAELSRRGHQRQQITRRGHR